MLIIRINLLLYCIVRYHIIQLFSVYFQCVMAKFIENSFEQVYLELYILVNVMFYQYENKMYILKFVSSINNLTAVICEYEFMDVTILQRDLFFFFCTFSRLFINIFKIFYCRTYIYYWNCYAWILDFLQKYKSHE